jgi:hypothetical protein
MISVGLMSTDDITKRNLKTSTTNIIDNSKPGASQVSYINVDV